MSGSERRHGHREAPPKRTLPQLIAIGIFALMALGAPLAFGAVDRLPQIVLLLLLLIGILVQPPAVVPLSRWGNRLAITFVALMLFKEFAPAGWFGATVWRSTVTREFGLQLPVTHHPEPGRAIEGLLAGTVAMIWFLWVRRLAAERENRALLAMILVAAAVVVAVVSFVTRAPGSDAIYGLRFTPGWSGFGPFPNRNHSACYFAMSALVGCGCVAWAGRRKKWLQLGASLLAVAVILVALLTTESRGGVVAFSAGFGAFLLLCILKVRSKRSLAVAFGAVLIFGAIALVFGAQVFARFQAKETSNISNATRVLVWQDAIGMWRDAPLLGHGLGGFASIFPLYQKFELENQIAIHPESSWLQWLTEVGAVPVLLAVVAAFLFLSSQLRHTFARHRSFFLHASGFAVVACLLVHALFDVPAHRWGTVGFALAALAIACPISLAGRRVYEPRQTALVPLVIVLYWAVPLLTSGAPWSPTALIKLIARHTVPPGVPLAELQGGLRWFPLNADLHQSTAFRLLRLHGREEPTGWQRHFAIAARLLPGSWDLTIGQARAVQRLSPVLALPYWQKTVARGGIHRDEVLASAWQETARSPAARAAWGRYVEANPSLLLAFARLVPEPQQGYYYGRWWKVRSSAKDYSEPEIRDFYALAPRWGQREQLDEWIARHPEREKKDFLAWATLLHAWGDDTHAWQLLAAHVPEPPFPAKAPTVPRPRLETVWRTTPQNLVNAQQLAQACDLAGDAAQRDEVLLAVATDPKSPPWFVEKAAHILARQRKIPEAVALLLRLP